MYIHLRPDQVQETQTRTDHGPGLQDPSANRELRLAAGGVLQAALGGGFRRSSGLTLLTSP